MKQELLVVDSTVDGKIRCTVRTAARGMHFQGALCRIDTEAHGEHQAILGRIGLVNTTNFVHDNPALKPLVMGDGHIPYFSGIADTETTTIDPISCVDLATGKRTGRKANPSSGTPVYLAEEEDLQLFINERRHLAYVGFMPGHPEVTISVQNKDSGPVEDGGWGEAHHQVTAGQSGSGKSILALVLTACKAVAHPGLGLLIPDTKGDIAIDDHNRGEFQFSFFELLRRGGRSYERLEIEDIRLESGALFAARLARILEQELSTNATKANELAALVASHFVDDKDRIEFEKISPDQIIERCLDELNGTFSPSTLKQKKERLGEIQADPARFRRRWANQLTPYFTGRLTCAQIAEAVLMRGQIYILNLHVEGPLQDAIMHELFLTIRGQCTQHFKEGKGRVNAEILLDEAPRWVPQSATPNSGASTIVDAVNTTRAYGLAFSFITQRLSALDKNVLAQSIVRSFGKNLGVGVDREHLAGAIGPAGIDLYDQLSLTDDFFFISVGPHLNLGAGQSPMSFALWGGNLTEKLIAMNPHLWKEKQWRY